MDAVRSQIENQAPGSDTDSLLARGRALMADPAQADRGMQLIVDAAHAGNGEAAYLVSLMAAVDTSVAERWTYALAYLGRAAKAGHGHAQKTLAFLSGDAAALAAIARGEKLPEPEWHRLHDAIDIAAWLRAPVPRPLSASPDISVAEGLLGPRICDWIVERARPHMQCAQVYDPRSGSGRTGLSRTNSEMRFSFEMLDLVLLFTASRIAALTGAAFVNMEPPSVLHYLPGQEFRPHYDHLDPAIPAYAAEIAKTGQRVATLLIYLNDDYGGGETDFPDAKFRFKGRKGDALLFRNVLPSGAPDSLTLHAGLAPTRGEKWLFSQWIRTKALPVL
jgi:prolyl 4-hydroxylase